MKSKIIQCLSLQKPSISHRPVYKFYTLSDGQKCTLELEVIIWKINVEDRMKTNFNN